MNYSISKEENNKKHKMVNFMRVYSCKQLKRLKLSNKEIIKYRKNRHIYWNFNVTKYTNRWMRLGLDLHITKFYSKDSKTMIVSVFKKEFNNYTSQRHCVVNPSCKDYYFTKICEVYNDDPIIGLENANKIIMKKKDSILEDQLCDEINKKISFNKSITYY